MRARFAAALPCTAASRDWKQATATGDAAISDGALAEAIVAGAEHMYALAAGAARPRRA